jgi:hypothetical protein
MGWIGVADRMPPREGRYLVHCPTADPKSPYVGVAWYHPSKQGGRWTLFPMGFKVAHWMEVPKPPEAARP